MFIFDRMISLWKEGMNSYQRFWEESLAVATRQVCKLDMFVIARSGQSKDNVSRYLGELQAKAIESSSFRFLLTAYDFNLSDEALDIYWPNMSLIHATRYGRVCTGLSKSGNTMVSVTPVSHDVVIVIYSDQGIDPQKDPIAAARTMTIEEVVLYRTARSVRDIRPMYYSFRSKDD